ncbi:MAG: SCP2 sterol-binding domain-containing protein [Acidocella sp.]|nr:SCP2 sterol-binding domain-containing protein [Acidocella sp.]
MDFKKLFVAATAASVFLSSAAWADTAPPVFMSPDWAGQLCDAWNHSDDLTTGLAGGWVHNDGGKGYKTLKVSDSVCTKSAPVELQIAFKDGKAICVYGGAIKGAAMDYGVDYAMWATTKNWQNMGSPMTAMMFGRLNFQGPKWEAMSNMGPFGAFLHLVAQVPGSVDYCPPVGQGA